MKKIRVQCKEGAQCCSESSPRWLSPERMGEQMLLGAVLGGRMRKTRKSCLLGGLVSQQEDLVLRHVSLFAFCSSLILLCATGVLLGRHL